jgi:type II secretion system protein N
VKQKLLKVARWVAYPLFYLFCLMLFGYLTFPFGQLRTRIIAEFDRIQEKQARRSRSEPMRLEIDELESYWFSGVEISGARLIIPPKPAPRRPAMSFGGKSAEPEAPPEPSVMTIDKVTARLQLLPLLIGNLRVDFDAEAFGGELSGSVPIGADGTVEIEFAGLQLIDVAPLQDLLQGIPLQGVAGGTVTLEPKEGKFAKADGHITLAIDTVKLGKKQKNEAGEQVDVLEMQGVELPSVLIGTLNVEASAKDGVLTIDEFGATGRDFELHGDGKVKLHESWDRSQADVYLKFKFSDAYRGKSDAASSLLGKPGAKFAPAIEVAPGSPFKRAKTDDDFYRFHIAGALGKIDFKPAATD